MDDGRWVTTIAYPRHFVLGRAKKLTKCIEAIKYLKLKATLQNESQIYPQKITKKNAEKFLTQ